MATIAAKITRQAQLQQILIGIGKHVPSAITLGGASYAPTDLAKLVQAELDAMTASAKAKTAYSAQVQVERNAQAKVTPVLRLLKSYVLAIVGDTQDASSTLGDFGYSPRKSAAKTLEVKVEAKDKTLATRAARHTLGKKQKAKIKGQVPVIAPAAATAPAPKA